MSRTLRVVAAAALAAAVLPALGGGTSGAAAGDPLYRPLAGFKPSGEKVRVAPERYNAVRIDLGRARDELRPAPRGGDGGVVFRVPTPTGGTERFAVHRTRVMEAELEAAHPELAAYAGRSLDHAETTIALDVTPMGLHAAVRGPQGRTWYVDPAYDRRGTTAHLSYHGGSVPRAEERFVEREAPEIRSVMRERQKAAGGRAVTQKVYRLAFLTDPTYAGYFDTDNVLAEKYTLINRVNQIYNDDLGIELRLIAETPVLNLDTEDEATGPNGPCGAHPCFDPRIGDPKRGGTYGQLEFCDVPTLGRTRVVLGQLVGASNYDIGHLGLGKNGGGIAYLGVAGWDYKGGGCTGLSEPKGDFFAIDYVAHELGHQFAGNHTFNGVQWACSGGNRNRATSVEPGSGSSVMAYAGICLQDDLQPHTDPYFSGKTLDEVNAYTRASLPTVAEVQTVSLTDFGHGDTLTLEFDGVRKSLTYEDYDFYDDEDGPVKIENVVEEITGEDVTIAGWGYDAFTDPGALLEPDDTGFQVTFAGSLDPEVGGVHQDIIPSLTVSDLSVGVEGFVGETAKGGPAANRGIRTVTGNRAPVVKAPANKTIPLRTPFKLKGSGSDADGNKLTYVWEQMDIGGASGTSLVDNRKRNGPLFRVFGTRANVTDKAALQSPSPGQNHAGTSRTRVFPDMAQILRGNTNAKSGKCPPAPPLVEPPGFVPVKPRIVDCFSEFLPTKGYVGSAGSSKPAMHFRLTARDGVDAGGGVGYDQVTLRIKQNAGPFLVSSFTKGGKVRPGSRKVIRWQVNGTEPLAERVRILLSTNNGRTWKKVLAKATANDGRATVRFPRVTTRQARIMISARGNYFFDVNDRPFKILR